MIKARATVIEFAPNALTGHEIRLNLQKVSGDINKIASTDKDLDIEIKVHRERRSLNANAMHWALCGRLADVLDSTLQEIHKELILKYGSLKIEEDGVAAYMIRPDTWEPSDTDYVKSVGEIYLNTRKKGRVRHLIYLIFKESHLYDQKEMSALISGTIDECKAQGVCTWTKHEIDQALAAWKSMG